MHVPIARAKPTIPLDTLDFLRGIAAVYVLMNHVRGSFFAGGRAILEGGNTTIFDYAAIALLQFTTLGGEFVILFFVISGFAMANSVASSTSTIRFYLKRVIRIWPPYIAAVAVAALVASLIGNSELTNPWRLAEVIFYIRPSTDLTPQFWSLPYEVVFYILCPLILVGRNRVRRFLYVATLASGAAFLTEGISFNPFSSFFLNFLGNELIFFAAGAAAYYYSHLIPELAPRLTAAVTFLIFFSVVGLKLLIGDMSMVTNLLMVMMTLLLVRNMAALPRYLRMFNFGHFSYSIYIFHFAFVALASFLALRWFGLAQHEMTSYVGWVILVFPILGACWLLYLVTEKPCNAVLTSMRRAEKRDTLEEVGSVEAVSAPSPEGPTPTQPA